MKSDALIIGLVGKQGAGKSSTKDALLRQLTGSAHARFASVIYKMHDAIREIAVSHGIPMPTKDGPLLQHLGTEWGRGTYGEDVWVQAFTVEYERLCQSYDFVVVDDVRFTNEAQRIRDLGGILVHLDADEDTRHARIPDTWRDPTHPSETGLDSWDDFDMDLDASGLSTQQLASLIIGYVTPR